MSQGSRVWLETGQAVMHGLSEDGGDAWLTAWVDWQIQGLNATYLPVVLGKISDSNQAILAAVS